MKAIEFRSFGVFFFIFDGFALDIQSYHHTLGTHLRTNPWLVWAVIEDLGCVHDIQWWHLHPDGGFPPFCVKLPIRLPRLHIYFRQPSRACMHARMHTHLHTHTYTHTYAHVCKHTHTHACTRAHTHAHAHVHMHSCTQMHSLTQWPKEQSHVVQFWRGRTRLHVHNDYRSELIPKPSKTATQA